MQGIHGEENAEVRVGVDHSGRPAVVIVEELMGVGKELVGSWLNK